MESKILQTVATELAAVALLFLMILLAARISISERRGKGDKDAARYDPLEHMTLR
ncbi:MAG: hypothetical protein QOJ65_1658 [Fimbriimonadaceae bacterium]|jgi:hypothetical protein|nr:hypothetical protein [Fimbriimonadaceae bacterium]